MTDTTRRCIDDYEKRRLQALASYQILDTLPEPAFDDLVEVASIICDAPIAVINFIDRDRQWFKSEKGLGVRETPLDISICAHAILQPGLFVVPDTTQDPRFANNPLVTGEPHLRFYAGALLESSDGYPLGTLCVLDFQPRELTERQGFALKALANQVMAHMQLMQAHHDQAELIGELKATRRKLAERAATDPLTGLLNRRAFEEHLKQEVALMQRGAPSAALMLIDIDHFKAVNDTLGHQARDEVLLRFAEHCREVFRESDVICRWGGEEFMVLLPMTNMTDARHAAERLHHLLSTTPMLEQEDARSPLHITVSIGICSLDGNSNIDACINQADQLLYQAKSQGRNRTSCATT